MFVKRKAKPPGKGSIVLNHRSKKARLEWKIYVSRACAEATLFRSINMVLKSFLVVLRARLD